MGRAFFVTGTDTEVGKTLVACALLYAARARGLSCLGLKPIAAGCERRAGRWVNEDALALIEAAGWEGDYESVNPVALAPAIAPHIALDQSGRSVTAESLAEHCQRVIDGHGSDFALAEGAGGWLVPLNDTQTLADVAGALRLDVVLVVGMQLGCINHATLTAESVAARGLRLAGWVANSARETMPYLEENLGALRRRLPGPCLGHVPHLPGAGARDAVPYLDLDLLLAAPPCG